MFISSHKSFIEVSICRAQYFIVIMHHGDYKFSQKTIFPCWNSCWTWYWVFSDFMTTMILYFSQFSVNFSKFCMLECVWYTCHVSLFYIEGKRNKSVSSFWQNSKTDVLINCFQNEIWRKFLFKWNFSFPVWLFLYFLIKNLKFIFKGEFFGG